MENQALFTKKVVLSVAKGTPAEIIEMIKPVMEIVCQVKEAVPVMYQTGWECKLPKMSELRGPFREKLPAPYENWIVSLFPEDSICTLTLIFSHPKEMDERRSVAQKAEIPLGVVNTLLWAPIHPGARFVVLSPNQAGALCSVLDEDVGEEKEKFCRSLSETIKRLIDCFTSSLEERLNSLSTGQQEFYQCLVKKNILIDQTRKGLEQAIEDLRATKGILKSKKLAQIRENLEALPILGKI